VRICALLMALWIVLSGFDKAAARHRPGKAGTASHFKKSKKKKHGKYKAPKYKKTKKAKRRT